MVRIAMQILWPAFLMAGVLETLVFAMVDPGDVRLFGGEALAWSPSGVYTLAFLVFWFVIATACAGTALLLIETDDPADTTGLQPKRPAVRRASL